MAICKETTRTVYMCSICHNEYETEEIAKQCEECGRRVQLFKEQFVQDELRWYLLRYDPIFKIENYRGEKKRWVLGGELEQIGFSKVDYPYANKSSCIHSRMAIVDANNHEYVTSTVWCVENSLTLSEAFRAHDLIPNIPRMLYDCKFTYLDCHREQLDELWREIVNTVKERVGLFSPEQLYQHTVNSILHYYVNGRKTDREYRLFEDPQEVSKKVLEWEVHFGCK